MGTESLRDEPTLLQYTDTPTENGSHVVSVWSSGDVFVTFRVAGRELSLAMDWDEAEGLANDLLRLRSLDPAGGYQA